jgi:hypothetical protein
VRAEVLGVDEEDYTHYDNADRLIMQNRKLFLEMRPRDAARFGLMKQPFWNIKKALRDGDLSKLKQKTKKKLLEVIKSHASYHVQ